ncbi:MAG: DNA translocase FtsK, partial [Eubacteriales bacterium]|nr:DNA translocase FtsK [Eubacteriales bacterium]
PKQISAAAPKPAPKPKQRPYVYPKLNLLERGVRSSGNGSDSVMKNARKLEKVLRDFGVGVSVTNVVIGPRVSRYELTPAAGVKVSRITSLSGDIKLALAARDIRIEAPIPGKSAVGVEVPNESSSTVKFRDILESEQFRNSRSKLCWGLGLDIGGNTVISDIAKMPHILVAGTTGSGKSVGINSLIMSVLYRAAPSEVRMILVDPKQVEFTVYNGIPHLLTPVVTTPEKALSALNWAVAEMNRRYKLFQSSGTRNIASYNDKVSRVSETLPEEDRPQKLPFILIIIDELSELMMHAKKDVESCIVSLAQLARAAGIHLVVATQRPSVDVITGLIKSNIPSRVAFKLPSVTDSRTILDSGGAEALLGNGDMLYKPGDKSSPIRVQGAFLSDEEVETVVEYIRKTNPADSGSEIEDEAYRQLELNYSGQQTKQAEADNSGRDEYFADAGRLIIASQKASIGGLQRKFKIGFNRAARIMDQLCEAGVVSEGEGTKERQIIMDASQFEELLGK